MPAQQGAMGVSYSPRGIRRLSFGLGYHCLKGVMDRRRGVIKPRISVSKLRSDGIPVVMWKGIYLIHKL